MRLGNVMLDVVGTELTPDDERRLRHPKVGGVILFARNYRDPQQLVALTGAIRALREPQLLIAVDHEGGRVQRFRSGFCAIPPMRTLGQLWDKQANEARAMAFDIGKVIALELAAHGVDFSFTPVLDLDHGNSSVIGDRAFHSNVRAVIDIATALIEGLHSHGMIAVGKHFPGHGYCSADSHLALPTDPRSLTQIESEDAQPFAALAAHHLDAVMPAHVVYSQVDSRTAGFSSYWLRDVLRQKYGFKGVIFSDDLSMEGASVAGDVVARATAALDAGCDMALLCNQPEKADLLLDGLTVIPTEEWATRVEALRTHPQARSPMELAKHASYADALSRIKALV